MSKKIRESVAVIISDDENNFLAVKRAVDDSFSNMWGLPAATLRSEETHEDAAKRAAKDKLGVEIDIIRIFGDRTEDKGNYISHMTAYEVKILSGVLSLETRNPSVSRYAEMKFSDEPSLLVEAAKNGSVCSRIFLTKNGIDW